MDCRLAGRAGCRGCRDRTRRGGRGRNWKIQRPLPFSVFPDCERHFKPEDANSTRATPTLRRHRRRGEVVQGLSLRGPAQRRGRRVWLFPQGGRSFANILGGHVTLFREGSGYSSGTIAHEFGHQLIGLGDSYREDIRLNLGCGMGPNFDPGTFTATSNTIMQDAGSICRLPDGRSLGELNPMWGSACDGTFGPLGCGTCTACAGLPSPPADTSLRCDAAPLFASEFSVQSNFDSITGRRHLRDLRDEPWSVQPVLWPPLQPRPVRLQHTAARALRQRHAGPWRAVRPGREKRQQRSRARLVRPEGQLPAVLRDWGCRHIVALRQQLFVQQIPLHH